MDATTLALGDRLRRRREERHISLKEVENATSIRMGYLEAIEGGEIKKLPSPIYAQGFIKKYASFLELDGERLLKEHAHLLEELTEQHDDKSDFAFGIGTVEVRGTAEGESRWKPGLLWIGISSAVVVILWFTLRALGWF